MLFPCIVHRLGTGRARPYSLRRPYNLETEKLQNKRRPRPCKRVLFVFEPNSRILGSNDEHMSASMDVYAAGAAIKTGEMQCLGRLNQNRLTALFE